jgi:hypothetical protein
MPPIDSSTSRVSAGDALPVTAANFCFSLSSSFAQYMRRNARTSSRERWHGGYGPSRPTPGMYTGSKSFGKSTGDKPRLIWEDYTLGGFTEYPVQVSEKSSEYPAGVSRIPSEVVSYTLPRFLAARARKMHHTYCEPRLAVKADDELAFRVMRQPLVRAQPDGQSHDSGQERALSLGGMRT